jgi:hypothetical protein
LRRTYPGLWEPLALRGDRIQALSERPLLRWSKVRQA